MADAPSTDVRGCCRVERTPRVQNSSRLTSIIEQSSSTASIINRRLTVYFGIYSHQQRQLSTVTNMHKFTAILPLAASLLHGIAALPRLASPEHQVDIRSVDKILAPTVVGVYVCVDADYKGQCSYLQNPPGMCGKLAQIFEAGPKSHRTSNMLINT